MLLDYALLCKEAYANGIEVNDHSFATGFVDDKFVIAFAGTANIENILHDASIWPSFTPSKSLAHAGMVHAYRELRDVVLDHIPKDLEVVFTGHSLGGGIALMFAELFGAEVITFGCLKTYFRFWPAPNLKHTRVVCDDDPVQHIPAIMYRHREIPIRLFDEDGFDLDISDHFLNEYIKRLKRRGL